MSLNELKSVYIAFDKDDKESDDEDEGPSSPESDCYDDFNDNRVMGRDDLDNEICYGTIQGIIRGIQYYSGTVNKNEMVTLERNPNNEYDFNAIKVNNVGNVQVGHIMRELAEPLAFIMDKNLARLEALVGDPESNGYSLYLTLTLWGKQENKLETVGQLNYHGFYLTGYTIPGEKGGASGTSDRKPESECGGTS